MSIFACVFPIFMYFICPSLFPLIRSFCKSYFVGLEISAVYIPGLSYTYPLHVLSIEFTQTFQKPWYYLELIMQQSEPPLNINMISILTMNKRNMGGSYQGTEIVVQGEDNYFGFLDIK